MPESKSRAVNTTTDHEPDKKGPVVTDKTPISDAAVPLAATTDNVVALDPVAPVSPSRVKFGDFAKQHFQVYAFPETTQEMIEDEKMWVHVSRMFRPGDSMAVLTDDMRDLFECIIIAAGERWAHVTVLRHYELGDRGRRNISTYEAKWAGPIHKYRVTCKETGVVAAHGFENMVSAEEWIFNRRKKDLT